MADDKKPGKFRALQFGQASRPKEGVEGRGAPRHQVSRIMSCSIIHLPCDIPMEVKLHDISTSGIGVYAPLWLDPGTFLVVKIQGWRGIDRTLKAKVVHATRVQAGCWLLGCSLQIPLTRFEVEDLL